MLYLNYYYFSNDEKVNVFKKGEWIEMGKYYDSFGRSTYFKYKCPFCGSQTNLNTDKCTECSASLSHKKNYKYFD